jgi:hypothetical protein
MEKSISDRLKELNNSINGGVEPMDEIKLPTPVIKKFLGLFLLQAVFIALIWSITSKSISPWIIPLSSFLQVGWIWNKVTESWKLARGYYNYSNDSVIENSVYSLNPPNLNVESTPVIGRNNNSNHPLFETTSTTNSSLNLSVV